jgi:hypothetical protein
MPLLDHFHTPLYPHRAWESFHSRWANCAEALLSSSPSRLKGADLSGPACIYSNFSATIPKCATPHCCSAEGGDERT